MTSYKNKNIDIRVALNETFTGFKKSWIILCSVSAIIFLSQSWLPKLLEKYAYSTKYIKPYIETFVNFKNDIFNITNAGSAFINLKNSLRSLFQNSIYSREFHLLISKIMLGLFVFFLLLCLLYIITIYISKNSVREKKTDHEFKKAFSKSHLMTFSYLVLSVIKVIPFTISIAIPFVYILINIYFVSNTNSQSVAVGVYYIVLTLLIICSTILGLLISTYIYLRLYFTGFIITEESTNPIHAIKVSWEMTESHLKKIFYIFLITLIIDIVSALTIIGFIPGTGLKYTLRASAYKQLRD
jgi:hypothetical protein